MEYQFYCEYSTEVYNMAIARWGLHVTVKNPESEVYLCVYGEGRGWSGMRRARSVHFLFCCRLVNLREKGKCDFPNIVLNDMTHEWSFFFSAYEWFVVHGLNATIRLSAGETCLSGTMAGVFSFHVPFFRWCTYQWSWICLVNRLYISLNSRVIVVCFTYM